MSNTGNLKNHQMNADQVMRRMQQAYAALDSYQDKCIKIHGNEEDHYSTWFERPHNFRFEYSDMRLFEDEEDLEDQLSKAREPSEDGVSEIYTDGKRVLQKPFYKSRASELDLEAYDNVTIWGWHPLQILMPEQFSNSLPALIENLEHRETQVLEGAECHVLAGDLYMPGDAELWIDTSTFLLRGVRFKIWFREMQLHNIAEDLPDISTMPFSDEFVYTPEL